MTSTATFFISRALHLGSLHVCSSVFHFILYWSTKHDLFRKQFLQFPGRRCILRIIIASQVFPLDPDVWDRSLTRHLE